MHGPPASREAAAGFGAIVVAVENFAATCDAFPLSLKLARFAGILRTMPLSDSGSGELQRRIERFVARWSSSEGIAASLREFESEAALLLAAIGDRMDRGNRDLFPLADQRTGGGGG